MTQNKKSNAKVIHYFFNDSDTQKVLENFIPVGDTGPLLAEDCKN